MKRFACIMAMAVLSAPALATDMGDPGYYGRIDINGMSSPQTLHQQPIVVQPHAGASQHPIYLNVPPDHAKNWPKYCDRYDACGEPAHFVDNRWYNERYVPQYRERHGGNREDHRR
ncbi:hypothetical protein CF70_002765 [Cupriavidus sp. SK-3]|uniref:hypothetical protein n=1 Tax=Cupriavidus sp. SK-3 TaxID=1470558 RepID=UPI00044BBE59|nr:hypothetical protein [Cupriavidus sp. SK-3]KDP87187.1 hypothetical protein CF70_002765 [Cupriavidus sp. SK-3]